MFHSPFRKLICVEADCSCSPLWRGEGGRKESYQPYSNVLVLGAQKHCFENSLASFHPVSKQRDMQSIHRNLITESVSRKAGAEELALCPDSLHSSLWGGSCRMRKKAQSLPRAHSDPKKKRMRPDLVVQTWDPGYSGDGGRKDQKIKVCLGWSEFKDDLGT